jgi:hypothetical protein
LHQCTRKVRRKRQTKSKVFEDLNISELEAHRQQGGTLTPPLATLSNLTAASWKDAFLNDVLWAAVLCGNLERHVYLDIFRHTVANARSSLPNRQDTYITHSVLSVLADHTFDTILEPILQHDAAKEALRSLLLIDCLPDRHHWARHLRAPDPAGPFCVLDEGSRHLS